MLIELLLHRRRIKQVQTAEVINDRNLKRGIGVMTLVLRWAEPETGVLTARHTK